VVVVLVAVLAVLLAAALLNARVLREYERGVVFRLGRLRPLAGPGLVMLVPFVDRMTGSTCAR
jgi:regulator of protease activity HflC (stomatin/prohibitin superfamily)